MPVLFICCSSARTRRERQAPDVWCSVIDPPVVIRDAFTKVGFYLKINTSSITPERNVSYSL